MSEDTDHYAILGVDPGADLEEIRSAYRERARACHPDRVASMDEAIRRLAEEKMVQINEAHRVLASAALRARYDVERQRRPAVPHPTPAPDSARRPRPPQAAPARRRMEEETLVTRGAAEQFRGRLRNATPRFQWTEVEAAGIGLALQGIRGRARYHVLFDGVKEVDPEALRALLRRFHSWTRRLDSTWWRREHVHAFAAGLRFVELERLLTTVETFNETQAEAGRPLTATLIDLVNWNVAPGASDLDSHLRLLST